MSYDALPQEALRWARVAILDTVGCALAGVTLAMVPPTALAAD